MNFETSFMNAGIFHCKYSFFGKSFVCLNEIPSEDIKVAE